ncbi:MAG: hypothetical protein IT267_02060 [Saprospiraceae bacterium]|nr:hypothetical protein [Saprospiraceae bacterium]
MNHHFTRITFLAFMFNVLLAQQKVDGSFDFQNERSKKYSLYVPKDFSATGNAILALHPLNTSRWNARSWRDTLTKFAEENNALLICPDGGVDGRVDDIIDTAFTTVLLDSVSFWYPFNKSTLVALGFSWGGRTVYTYGLTHIDFFKGLIAVGAAIEGVDLNSISESAKGKNIFILHGSLDALESRYYPAVNAFKNKGSCLEDSILNGVNHTIDFPNRNAVLSRAYQFTLYNQCKLSAIELSTDKPTYSLVRLGNDIILNSAESIEFNVFDLSGKDLGYILLKPGINTVALNSGFFIFQSRKFNFVERILIP